MEIGYKVRTLKPLVMVSLLSFHLSQEEGRNQILYSETFFFLRNPESIHRQWCNLALLFFFCHQDNSLHIFPEISLL